MERFKFIFSVPKESLFIDNDKFYSDNEELYVESLRFFGKEEDVYVISIENLGHVNDDYILKIYTIGAERDAVDNEIPILYRISKESSSHAKFRGVADRSTNIDTGDYIWTWYWEDRTWYDRPFVPGILSSGEC